MAISTMTMLMMKSNQLAAMRNSKIMKKKSWKTKYQSIPFPAGFYRLGRMSQKYYLHTTRVFLPQRHTSTYFGILDLSGEDVEVKKLFTENEWDEIIEDFRQNVQLSDLKEEQEQPLYHLMNRITEILNQNPSDVITAIESCVINDNEKINAIRRLIQTYAYNLQRLHLPMSEGAFGSNFTSMITKGILTFDQIYHYEEGVIQSLGSAVVSNLNTKPTDRSHIGQKVDFRISRDSFEVLIGLRSGGLPPSPKGKKWLDKVDLAVALRDVLVGEGIENNGIALDQFRKLYTLGVYL